jgi:hypothetical protein
VYCCCFWCCYCCQLLSGDGSPAYSFKLTRVIILCSICLQEKA